MDVFDKFSPLNAANKCHGDMVRSLDQRHIIQIYIYISTKLKRCKP